MYTNDQVDQETLRVLMGASAGKDPEGRPKGLCTYQICDSFDDQMAAYFIGIGGVGGAGGGAAGPAFTQLVQYSLKRLQDRGLVRHYYMDTRGLAFDIKGHPSIRPSYAVMAVYQYTGDIGPRERVKVGPRAAFVGPSSNTTEVRTAPKAVQIDASTSGIAQRTRPSR